MQNALSSLNKRVFKVLVIYLYFKRVEGRVASLIMLHHLYLRPSCMLRKDNTMHGLDFLINTMFVGCFLLRFVVVLSSP